MLNARSSLLMAASSLGFTWSALAAPPSDPTLVSGGETLAVVKENVVEVYTADGRSIARLGASAAGPPAPAAPSPEAARERLFDLYGVPEASRDTQAAEDLFDEEATLSDRQAAARRAEVSGRGPGRALAAGSTGGLVALAAGALYRVDRTTVMRLGPAPSGVTALAETTAPRQLWLARGPDVLRIQRDGTLQTVARGTDAIAALVGGRGWLAWITGDTLTIAAIGGSARGLLIPTPVRALAACGPDLLILAADGLHVAGGLPASEATPQRVSGPLPGDRLACRGDGRGPWLVVGPGLLASADRGRTWRPRADLPAVPLAAAAIAAGDRLWLLARGGALMALPLGETLPAAARGASLDDQPAPLPRRSVWLGLLPRLAIAASHVERGPRHEQRLLAFAEFPLEAAPSPAPSTAPAAPPVPVPPLPPDGPCLPLVRARAVERALVDPARARSLVARAGRSAWLPELRLRVERRLGRNESLDVKPAATSDALGLDTADDVRYEVRATWDLPRLVFNPEEVAAHHQALRTAEMRRELESQVNRLFFERRRLLLEPTPGPAEQGERLLRLDELAAELDAMSGGVFSQCAGPGGPTQRP